MIWTLIGWHFPTSSEFIYGWILIKLGMWLYINISRGTRVFTSDFLYLLPFSWKIVFVNVRWKNLFSCFIKSFDYSLSDVEICFALRPLVFEKNVFLVQKHTFFAFLAHLAPLAQKFLSYFILQNLFSLMVCIRWMNWAENCCDN